MAKLYFSGNTIYISLIQVIMVTIRHALFISYHVFEFHYC